MRFPVRCPAAIFLALGWYAGCAVNNAGLGRIVRRTSEGPVR